MDKYNYLIVGGGAAGVTAAETIRAKDANASIAVVNDEPEALYSRVMLSKPNFFLGKIPFDQVFLKGKEWYDQNHIKFLGGHKATGLDAGLKTLSLENGDKLEYEKLLLATGASTRKWTVPGAEKKGIYYLRTLDDGKRIMEGIKTAKHAVTIGGGFISFEMADLLRLANIEVTMLLRENYFWEPILDAGQGKMLEDALTKGGVKVLKNVEVAEVQGGDSVQAVILKDGTKIDCDMVIAGIGVFCDLDWVKPAGLQVNRGILATEFMETNLPNVWTAGDVAEYFDPLLEERTQMGNWVNAREQGRVAALNMMGNREPFKFVSFYTTQGFGVSIAMVGDVRPGPDRIIIPRGSPEVNSYARVILVGPEVVGATMINRTKELTDIAKLIDSNVNVSDKYKELTDPNFDLKQLFS